MLRRKTGADDFPGYFRARFAVKGLAFYLRENRLSTINS
jgi:hypothetical protein